MKIYSDQKYPIFSWMLDDDVQNEITMEQVNLVADLPFIYHHIALMADGHPGMGSAIGSVVATRGAVIPAAVGVDIGCGMMAVQTTLHSSRLPINLSAVRSAIEAAVPHGRTDNGGKNDRGAWGDTLPAGASDRWGSLAERYTAIIVKHPKAKAFNTWRHMGTLGTGNHFIEVCVDKNETVWVMLHSGSRGCGNRIGTYFIQRAKKEMERWFINLPDKDLAYLVEGSDLFKDYVEAVEWAQDFALNNREEMMRASLAALKKTLPEFLLVGDAINCHHNYLSRENHFGKNVLVTRKGAVRAREGDMGIIPGSMGAKSYIVRGKGNPMSFHSCSHGAGRAMSRTEAKKRFTTADHASATEGVECRKDDGVLDETPGAYKNIDDVMAAQTDLVEIVHTLKQVLCVKG